MALIQFFHLYLLFEVLQLYKIILLFSCMVTQQIFVSTETFTPIFKNTQNIYSYDVESHELSWWVTISPSYFPIHYKDKWIDSYWPGTDHCVLLCHIIVNSFQWCVNQHRAGFICNESLVDFYVYATTSSF